MIGAMPPPPPPPSPEMLGRLDNLIFKAQLRLVEEAIYRAVKKAIEDART